MIESAQFRQSYLDFFERREHKIVPSASLLPTAPNLLFTNAGMNQFVPYFLGERAPPYPRAADTQKCIRAGGKHNDLEDVGFDNSHHTFFEMLGNWSFGDYFKEEAIRWAWELLTKVWEIPGERLYATIYQPGERDPGKFDAEAHRFWTQAFSEAGLDPSVHIKPFDKTENLWMMGDTGPCGPCSEIHMDLTEKADTGGRLVNGDSPYCMEIWNLVFIQFNAEEDGSFTPLSSRHVDTGLGFERVAGIAATSDGFKDFSRIASNYDSDLFTDLFAHLTDLSGHRYAGTLPEDRNSPSPAEMKDCAFRVLADHVRTLSCAVADGIIPGSGGRNYVLRRILRRAVLFSRKLQLPRGSFAKLVEPTVAKLGPVFPELVTQKDLISRVIASEEEAFEATIDRGLTLFEKIADSSSGVISGSDAFTLYDTYGFPLDLTQIVAREKNLAIDLAGFREAMEQQRTRARAAQKKSVIAVVDGDDSNAESGAGAFVGFESENLNAFESEVVDVVDGGGGERFLVCAESPFYAEMGGQIGDTGNIEVAGAVIPVSDTIRDPDDRILHRLGKGPNTASAELIGKPARLSVDLVRRQAIQCHHTATHVLHWALRKVLGTHVQQAGSLVTEERLRFDFSHFEQPEKHQLAEIERLANERILSNSEVSWYETPFDEKPTETIAFFGEKYGDIVRVVDIGGWSLELCGGTHVGATGEIGLLKITGESAIAAGTRRVEAVVAESAFQIVTSKFDILANLARKLSCPPEEVERRFDALLERASELEKALQEVRRKDAAGQAGELAAKAVLIEKLPWVSAVVNAPNPEEMRKLAIAISKELGEGVVVLGGAFGEKVNFLALASPKAIEQGIRAGDIVKRIAPDLGGRGGGKPDFAMGGGTEPDKLESVLKGLLAPRA